MNKTHAEEITEMLNGPGAGSPEVKRMRKLRGSKMTEEQAFLKGANKKNPQRYRKKVVKNNMALGHPPDHLPDEAKNIWYEIQGQSLPDTLTGSERVHMEALSLLLMEFRADPFLFPNARLPVMVNLLAKLGMNPIDRQKLAKEPEKEKPKNGFADFGGPTMGKA